MSIRAICSTSPSCTLRKVDLFNPCLLRKAIGGDAVRVNEDGKEEEGERCCLFFRQASKRVSVLAGARAIASRLLNPVHTFYRLLEPLPLALSSKRRYFSLLLLLLLLLRRSPPLPLSLLGLGERKWSSLPSSSSWSMTFPPASSW